MGYGHKPRRDNSSTHPRNRDGSRQGLRHVRTSPCVAWTATEPIKTANAGALAQTNDVDKLMGQNCTNAISRCLLLEQGRVDLDNKVTFVTLRHQLAVIHLILGA